MVAPLSRGLKKGFAAALVVAGCGGASLGSSLHDVGRGTLRDIRIVVPDALIREGYAVANFRETANSIYFETAWETRAPFEDEEAAGARECRTRIVVEGRKGGADIYRVTLRAENNALMEFSGEWSPLPPTEMLDDHLRAIAEFIRLEIDTGVRIGGLP